MDGCEQPVVADHGRDAQGSAASPSCIGCAHTPADEAGGAADGRARAAATDLGVASHGGWSSLGVENLSGGPPVGTSRPADSPKPSSGSATSRQQKHRRPAPREDASHLRPGSASWGCCEAGAPCQTRHICRRCGQQWPSLADERVPTDIAQLHERLEGLSTALRDGFRYMERVIQDERKGEDVRRDQVAPRSPGSSDDFAPGDCTALTKQPSDGSACIAKTTRMFGSSLSSSLSVQPLSEQPLSQCEAPSVTVVAENTGAVDMKPTGSGMGMLAQYSRGYGTGLLGELPSLSQRATFNRLERASMLLILTNTVFLGVEADVRMHAVLRGKRSPPDWISYANMVFASLFTLELVGKALRWRRVESRKAPVYIFAVSVYDAIRGRQPWSEVWQALRDMPETLWNTFDFILVVSSILDAIFEAFDIEFVDASMMRTFRIFRALRAARVLRTIGIFDQLHLMLAAIVSSFASVFWAFMLLLILLFMYSIAIMSGVEGHLLDSGMDQPLIDMFGGLGTTMLSLLMSISGGVDWGELVKRLKMVSGLYVPTFVLFVFFVSFSVVGILTASIIDASEEILHVDRSIMIRHHMKAEQATRKHLRELFQLLDVGKRGHLSARQLKEAIKNPEVCAFLKSVGLNYDLAKDFLLVDRDRSQTVNEKDFIDGLMHNDRSDLLGSRRAMSFSDPDAPME